MANLNLLHIYLVPKLSNIKVILNTDMIEDDSSDELAKMKIKYKETPIASLSNTNKNISNNTDIDINKSKDLNPPTARIRKGTCFKFLLHVFISLITFNCYIQNFSKKLSI